jgi:hypothetical protein
MPFAEQVSGQSWSGWRGPADLIFRMHIGSVIWKHFDSRDVLPFQQQAFGPRGADFGMTGPARFI